MSIARKGEIWYNIHDYIPVRTAPRKGICPVDREVTSQDLENLAYRKKRLHRKLEQLENLLSGGGGSLLPLVRGEDGRWSEERGRSLIRELADALDLSLRGEAEKPEAPTPLSQLPSALTREQRELFECFLYCALRAMESPMPVSIWSGAPGGKWEGLLGYAAQMDYQDKYTLYYDETYRSATGFFCDMDQIYEALTGQAAVRKASPLDIQAMENLFQAEIAEETLLPRWEDLPPEVLEEFSEPYTEEDREEQRLSEAALAAWQDAFPQKEAFCEAYLRLRTLFFRARAWRYLESWTERMVDLYLYQRESSSFLTDDAFFLAYGLLDRVKGELDSVIRGEE